MRKIKNGLRTFWQTLKLIYNFGGWVAYLSIFLSYINSGLEVYKSKVVALLIYSIAEEVVMSEPVRIMNLYNLRNIPSVHYGLVLLLIWIIQKIGYRIIGYAQVKFQTESLRKYKYMIINKLQKFNLSDMGKYDIYRGISKINDVWYSNFTNFYSLIQSVGGSIIGVILAGSAIMQYKPFWGYLVVAVILPSMIIKLIMTYKDVKRIDKLTMDRIYRDYVYTQTTDSRTFAEKKTNNYFSFFLKRFRGLSKKVAVSDLHFNAIGDLSTTLYKYMTFLVVFYIRFKLILLAIVKQISGKVAAYLFNYVEIFWNNVYQLVDQVSNLVTSLAYLQYMPDYLQIPTLHEASIQNKQIIPNNVTSIVVNNVTFKHVNTDKYILQNASMKINDNDKILIIGKDGSGKSTLARVFCGLYRIKEGDILIENQSIKKLQPGIWKDHISAMFDDFGRYYFSIKDNIVLGDIDKGFNKVLYEISLHVTYLDEWVATLADKDNTILGNLTKSSVEIPSGYWQRIAIARAIYRDRPIMLFDESFNYIDSHMSLQIMERLSTYWKDKIIIFIDESLQFHEYFNKHFMLENGNIIEIDAQKVYHEWKGS